jgi:hypothetical protein
MSALVNFFHDAGQLPLVGGSGAGDTFGFGLDDGVGLDDEVGLPDGIG